MDDNVNDLVFEIDSEEEFTYDDVKDHQQKQHRSADANTKSAKNMELSVEETREFSLTEEDEDYDAMIFEDEIIDDDMKDEGNEDEDEEISNLNCKTSKPSLIRSNIEGIKSEEDEDILGFNFDEENDEVDSDLGNGNKSGPANENDMDQSITEEIDDKDKPLIFKMINIKFLDDSDVPISENGSTTNVKNKTDEILETCATKCKEETASLDGSIKLEISEDDLKSSLVGHDGDLFFPSLEFVRLGGMGFLSQIGEMQREMALLQWKMSPELRIAAAETAQTRPDADSKLPAALLTVIQEGCVPDKQAVAKQGLTADELLWFKKLTKDHLQLKAVTEANHTNIYHGTKLVLFTKNHCDLFKPFTSRFALRSTNPLAEMFKGEFVIASSSYTHIKCSCLFNPLLKFTQVGRNIPLRVLPYWFKDRNICASRYGERALQLSLLGRGRRPNRIVMVCDSSMYPSMARHTSATLPNLGLDPLPLTDVFATQQLDHTQALVAIKQHSGYNKGNAHNLYVVLVNLGAVIDCATTCNNSNSDVNGDGGMGNNNNSKDADALACELADHVIDCCASLWRSLLLSTASCDALFVPAPLLTVNGCACRIRHKRHDQDGECAGGGCSAVVQRVTALFNQWVQLQNNCTGWCATESAPRLSAPEPSDEAGAVQLMPTEHQVYEQLHLTLRKVKNDMHKYEKSEATPRVSVGGGLVFERVVLVVERAYAACVAAYTHAIAELELCEVAELCAKTALPEVSAAMMDGSASSTLVALLPTFLPTIPHQNMADAATGVVVPEPHYEHVFVQSNKQRTKCSTQNKIMKDVEELVSSLRSKGLTNMKVVVLPCLPLHLLTQPPLDQSTLSNDESVGASQVLVLSAKNKKQAITELYGRFLKATFKFSVNSFKEEKLHSFPLIDFGSELEENANLLCSTSENCLQDPSLDIYGSFGRLLQGVYTNALLGFTSSPLPKVDELTMTNSYHTLADTANLQTKSIRYDKIVLVGDIALYSPLNSSYLDGKDVKILPNVTFSSASFSYFTKEVISYPPNTLFIFFVDVLRFTRAEKYPHCRKNKCNDAMHRFILDSIDFSMDELVQQWVEQQLEDVMHHLSLFKKSLPNQSTIILGPMSPQRVLLQESDPSYYNHNLLHSAYQFESKPIAFGNEDKWNNLYSAWAAMLQTSKYVLDVSLDKLMKEIKYNNDASSMLSCVNNPRLYDETFPEKIAWSDYIKEIICKVQKLKFPMKGISDTDMKLVDDIKASAAIAAKFDTSTSRSRCSSVSSNSNSKTASVADQVDMTPCCLSAPSSGFVSQQCKLLIKSGHLSTKLPKKFVEKLVYFFNPVGELEESTDPCGWLVLVPDMIRASLLVAVLHGFRCTMLSLSVAPHQELAEALPISPHTELRRLRACLWSRLLPVATNCHQAYLDAVLQDESSLESRAAVSDYVVGTEMTCCYLLEELHHLHHHHQNSIKRGQMLVLIVTSSPETATNLEQVLALALADTRYYSAKQASLTLLTRDSHHNTGHVVVGTSRFVQAVLCQLEHRQLVSLQMLVLEGLKEAMTTDQKRHMLQIIATVKEINKKGGSVRPVVVGTGGSSIDRIELSGANTLLDTTLRVVLRDKEGHGRLTEYNSKLLPKVEIRPTIPIKKLSAVSTTKSISNKPNEMPFKSANFNYNNQRFMAQRSGGAPPGAQAISSVIARPVFSNSSIGRFGVPGMRSPNVGPTPANVSVRPPIVGLSLLNVGQRPPNVGSAPNGRPPQGFYRGQYPPSLSRMPIGPPPNPAGAVSGTQQARGLNPLSLQQNTKILGGIVCSGVPPPTSFKWTNSQSATKQSDSNAKISNSETYDPFNDKDASSESSGMKRFRRKSESSPEPVTKYDITKTKFARYTDTDTSRYSNNSSTTVINTLDKDKTIASKTKFHLPAGTSSTQNISTIPLKPNEKAGAAEGGPWRVSRLRREVEAEYTSYMHSPQKHPMYFEQWRLFITDYQQRFREGWGDEHKKMQWDIKWKAFLKGLLEKDYAKRLEEMDKKTSSVGTTGNPAASTSSASGYSYGSNHSSSGPYKNPSSTASGYGNSPQYNKNYNPGSSVPSLYNNNSSSNTGKNNDGNNSYTRNYQNAPIQPPTTPSTSKDNDLDAESLAKRTRGLNSVELAVLIKQLVTEKTVPDPEAVFKKLFSEIIELHSKYAQELAGISF